jgi:hypothetical protein
MANETNSNNDNDNDKNKDTAPDSGDLSPTDIARITQQITK